MSSDPPVLSFAATAVGSTSADSPELLTIANIGNGALDFPAPGAGVNPTISSGFTLASATTCPEVDSFGTGCRLESGSLLCLRRRLHSSGPRTGAGFAATDG